MSENKSRSGSSALLSRWLRDQASGPMTQNIEHAETCDMLTKCANELDRQEAAMRKIVRVIRAEINDPEQGQAETIGKIEMWLDEFSAVSVPG